MPLFFTTEQAKARLHLNPEVNPPSLVQTLKDSIIGAQLRVEGLLSSKLAHQANNDIFYTSTDAFNGIRIGGLFRLYLASGLVRPDTVEVFSGSAWNDCNDPIPNTDYKVDPQKGLVFLDDKKYPNRFVRVASESGFTPASEDLNLAGDVLPEWLAEVCLTFLPLTYYPPAANDKLSKVESSGLLLQHANDVIRPYLRNNSFCLKPL